MRRSLGPRPDEVQSQKDRLPAALCMSNHVLRLRFVMQSKLTPLVGGPYAFPAPFELRSSSAAVNPCGVPLASLGDSSPPSEQKPE